MHIREDHLSDASLAQLHALIATQARHIFTAALRVEVSAADLFYSDSFSLRGREGGFGVIRTGTGTDTPMFGFNSFELLADASVAPLGLEDRYHQATGSISYPFSGISFHTDSTQIVQIDIYELHQFAQSNELYEAVTFDHALVFHRASGSQFCIAVDHNTVAGELFFCATPPAITETLHNSRKRYTVQ